MYATCDKLPRIDLAVFDTGQRRPITRYLANPIDKAKSPEAGPEERSQHGGGYADIELVEGKPEFMSRDGKAANKGLYYVRAGKIPLDHSKFQPGDEVASIVVPKFTGDRGNIDTAIG